MRTCLLALLLVLTAGCQVVVLGDSNTCMWVHGCREGDTFDWPARMAVRADWPVWTIVNRGLPSMAAGAYAGAAPLDNGEPPNGAWHLERLIREDLADACTTIETRYGPLLIRRKLVLSLGSNDVSRADVSAFAAGMAVRALYDRARQVPCVDVYVTTIPPRLDTPAMKIMQANAVIAMGVPADRLIPFGTQPTTDLDRSGVHMTGDGQTHRAALAFPVLFPAPASPG